MYITSLAYFWPNWYFKRTGLTGFKVLKIDAKLKKSNSDSPTHHGDSPTIRLVRGCQFREAVTRVMVNIIQLWEHFRKNKG